MRGDDAGLLFLDQGYAGARIGDVTDRCGISRAGFYTYFRGKREVFDALGVSAFREVRRCTTTTWCTVTRFVVGMLDAGRPPIGR